MIFNMIHLSIYSKTSLTNASLTKIPDSTITNNQSNLKLLPSSLLCALPESTIVQQTSVFSSDLTGLPESMIDVDAENVQGGFLTMSYFKVKHGHIRAFLGKKNVISERFLGQNLNFTSFWV